MPRNLIIAYVVTWVIHVGYLSYVVRRVVRLKDRSDSPRRHGVTEKGELGVSDL